MFGNYDMMPDTSNLKDFMNQMGSIGKAGDSETAGGGRLIIIADSMNMTGSLGSSLQANSLPIA